MWIGGDGDPDQPASAGHVINLGLQIEQPNKYVGQLNKAQQAQSFQTVWTRLEIQMEA